jgi:endonuclease YncB( thermonuclease family)
VGSPGNAVARHCRLFGLAVVIMWPIAGAFAQDPPKAPAKAPAKAAAKARPPPADGCPLEAVGTGKVHAVVDGRSFLLDDGREIRLPGIEVPLPPRPGETGARAEAGIAARAALGAILAGGTVELRQRAPAADRYGRSLAHAYVMRDGAQKSAAHEMLAAGFARVSAPAGEAACAAELLAQEEGARKAELGLWGEAYYAIIGAESLAELVAERGHFAVVEGKVVTVRESGGTIYVNFGRRWSQALTVTILKRNERNFVAAGLDPRGLANLRVRVRGWMEERNGAPRIEAMRPEQIEIAER